MITKEFILGYMEKVKEIANNRKAYHDYIVIDKYEAGLVLTGTEIKSIRKGKVQFKDAYVSFSNGEAYIKGMHIAEYKEGNRFNHDETRDRKLLLHKSEITKLYSKCKMQGYTVIPLRLYLKTGLAKMEVGLCQGKNLHDKRESDKIRSMEREIAKAMKY